MTEATLRVLTKTERRCIGYNGNKCENPMHIYHHSRKRCDECWLKYHGLIESKPKRICKGYQGYECNVSLEGEHPKRQRCIKCAKKYRLQRANQIQVERRRKQKDAKEKANPRICKGYEGYECDVSLKGTRGSIERCDDCNEEHLFQRRIEYREVALKERREIYNQIKEEEEEVNPRICEGYPGYICNVSLNGTHRNRKFCKDCADARKRTRVHESNPNDSKCVGYEGYECGVSLEGFNSNRKRCESCAKEQSRITSLKRLQDVQKRINQTNRSGVRTCLGYPGYVCKVSLEGEHGRRKRCRNCALKNANLWRITQNTIQAKVPA